MGVQLDGGLPQGGRGRGQPGEGSGPHGPKNEKEESSAEREVLEESNGETGSWPWCRAHALCSGRAGRGALAAGRGHRLPSACMHNLPRFRSWREQQRSPQIVAFGTWGVAHPLHIPFPERPGGGASLGHGMRWPPFWQLQIWSGSWSALCSFIGVAWRCVTSDSVHPQLVSNPSTCGPSMGLPGSSTDGLITEVPIGQCRWHANSSQDFHV